MQGHCRNHSAFDSQIQRVLVQESSGHEGPPLSWILRLVARQRARIAQAGCGDGTFFAAMLPNSFTPSSRTGFGA